MASVGNSARGCHSHAGDVGLRGHASCNLKRVEVEGFIKEVVQDVEGFKDWTYRVYIL